MQWSSHFQRVIVEVCIHCATGQDAKAFHTETLNNFMLRTWPNEFLTAEGISERCFVLIVSQCGILFLVLGKFYGRLDFGV